MRRLVILGIILSSLLALFTVTASAQETTATPVITLETYTVRTGDTLLSIGRAYGVSATAIARQNNLTNNNLIRPGQVLEIPINTDLLATPTTTTEYTVARGDTLFRIAARFNTTTTVLLRLNRLTNPNVLPIGLVIQVPAATDAPPVATTLATIAVSSTATPEPVVPTQTALPDTNLVTATVEAPASATSVLPTTPLIAFGRGTDVFLSGQSLDDILGDVARLDVQWIKLTINWRDVELIQGSLNLDVYDEAITALDALGLNILVTLTGAPDWARPSATPFVLSLAQYGPPDDVAEFGRFATAIADRYAGVVDAYEIWVEPNLRRSWIEATTSGRENARLSSVAYLDLLRAASEGIRAVDPDALIISAGLAPTGLNSPQNSIADRLFLHGLLTGGLLTLVDGIGVEPDGFANPPDAVCCAASDGVLTHFEQPEFYFLNTLADYHNLLTEAGGSTVSLWPTRFGWGSADGNTIAAPNMAENPFLTYTDQAEQAAYTVRAFELGAELGYVGPMFLYNLNGCVVQQAEACFYSLLMADGTPRTVGQTLGLTP